MTDHQDYLVKQVPYLEPRKLIAIERRVFDTAKNLQVSCLSYLELRTKNTLCRINSIFVTPYEKCQPQHHGSTIIYSSVAVAQLINNTTHEG